MNNNELCQSIIQAIKPFFKKELKETPIFHIKLGGRTHQIDVTTRTAKIIFIFKVECTSQADFISLDIIDKKYFPLYNKFLKYYKERSSDSFLLYMNAAKEQSDHLKLITQINVLPYAKRMLKFKDHPTSTIMSDAVHAKITTPFETFDVFRTPKFIFENNQLFLNDQFYFTSYSLDFSFCKYSESNDLLIQQYVDIFAKNFTILHHTNIIGSLCQLYGMNFQEAASFTNQEIMDYYPVLAIDHY